MYTNIATEQRRESKTTLTDLYIVLLSTWCYKLETILNEMEEVSCKNRSLHEFTERHCPFHNVGFLSLISASSNVSALRLCKVLPRSVGTHFNYYSICNVCVGLAMHVQGHSKYLHTQGRCNSGTESHFHQTVACTLVPS